MYNFIDKMHYLAFINIKILQKNTLITCLLHNLLLTLF